MPHYNIEYINMGLKEKDIEKAIRKYAESYGCIVYKFTSPGKRNVPDRIIAFPHGVVAFPEIKKPKGPIRSGQIRKCRNLQQNKVPAAIIDNINAGKRFIDLILTSTGVPAEIVDSLAFQEFIIESVLNS